MLLNIIFKKKNCSIDISNDSIIASGMAWRNNHKTQTQFFIILDMLIQVVSNQVHIMYVLVSELKLSLWKSAVDVSLLLNDSLVKTDNKSLCTLNTVYALDYSRTLTCMQLILTDF